MVAPRPAHGLSWHDARALHSVVRVVFARRSFMATLPRNSGPRNESPSARPSVFTPVFGGRSRYYPCNWLRRAADAREGPPGPAPDARVKHDAACGAVWPGARSRHEAERALQLR